jgi:hypothetical protein
VVDAGTFTLYLKGVRIGEERFVIRQELGGSGGPVFRAGAELNLKLDGRTQRIGVALETLGSECRPHRYEAEINGSEATTIVGTLVRDRIRLDVRSPQGAEMKEFLLHGRVAILERHIAHHHFFAWKLLAGNPSVEATVIVPRDRSQELVRIEDWGEEPVQIDDRELILRHVAIIAETGSSHHVWLDGDRVMRVDVPQDEFLAIRSNATDPSPKQPRGTS